MRWSRYALLMALFGNIALIVSLFWIAGIHTTERLILAGIFSLPLLASLNGLARARIYTAAWASMAALFYLAYAMVEYIAGAASLAVDLCLAASIAMFVGTVVFAKWDAREREAAGS
ncbi:hypothetical protein T35B1_07991 [Salinisphaera shabanensis T35B1]|uniref:DUF2069 domain-containing protein n=1 Tax=Salinisphaera shabanensis TaxID=180542 RepID=UPI00333EBBE4